MVPGVLDFLLLLTSLVVPMIANVRNPIVLEPFLHLGKLGFGSPVHPFGLRR